MGSALVGSSMVSVDDRGGVFVSEGSQVVVTLPSVGGNGVAWLDGGLDEALQGSLASVRDVGEPEASCAEGPLPLTTGLLELANLDGADDDDLIGDSAPLATGGTANKGFVDLNASIASDPVSSGPHHGRTKPVQELKGGLVSLEPQVALELYGRNPRRLTRDEIGAPEPHHQRHMGAVHDRPSGEAGVRTAGTAPQDRRPVIEAEGIAGGLTAGTEKARRPAQLLQVGGTGRLVREGLLKTEECSREGALLHELNCST